MARKRQDRWPELRKIVADDDGLPVRADVGEWTFDKLWWWNRYIEITTRAMVGHPKWPAGLVYVDLFAGPGVCTLKGTGERLPGSPLLAALAPKSFRKILLCEKNEKLAEACRLRLVKHGVEGQMQVFSGDCNDRIVEIAKAIPNRCLTLAFIDPTGLHARFETLRVLTSVGQVDLLVLFADAMDIVRNVALYADQSHSNLDDVLGPESNWRVRWAELANQSSANVSKLFVEIYEEQLRTQLGYSVFGSEVIRKPQGTPLYRLMYASKHPRGLDFWRKSTEKFRTGGRLF